MNSLLGLGLPNNLRFIKSELVACVQTVHGCEEGHVADRQLTETSPLTLAMLL